LSPEVEKVLTTLIHEVAESAGLRNALEFAIPGAILGVWAVTWGRKMEWRGLLIGWMWMAQVAMLVAYGVLFG
jgi:hypothetical protein